MFFQHSDPKRKTRFATSWIQGILWVVIDFTPKTGNNLPAGQLARPRPTVLIAHPWPIPTTGVAGSDAQIKYRSMYWLKCIRTVLQKVLIFPLTQAEPMF